MFAKRRQSEPLIDSCRVGRHGKNNSHKPSDAIDTATPSATRKLWKFSSPASSLICRGSSRERRIELTENCAVSLSMPTLTQPALAAMSVRHRLAKIFVSKIMLVDLVRTTFRPIVAAAIFELADQFLPLGIDRDHRLTSGLRGGNRGIDVFELRIAVGMAAASQGLAIHLPRVIQHT
jgi:hypothetical protein